MKEVQNLDSITNTFLQLLCIEDKPNTQKIEKFIDIISETLCDGITSSNFPKFREKIQLQIDNRPFVVRPLPVHDNVVVTGLWRYIRSS